jgi:hypothetical protein
MLKPLLLEGRFEIWRDYKSNLGKAGGESERVMPPFD